MGICLSHENQYINREERKMSENKNKHNMVLIDPVKDMPKLAEIAYRKKFSIAIMGPPGLGKTEGLRHSYTKIASKDGLKFVENPKFEDWLDEKNFCFLTLIGSTIQEVDAMGIPHIRAITGYGEITEFTPTSLFPQNGIAAQGIIFLDELGNAQEQVKNALQNYLTGGGNISTNIRFVAATNSMEDNSGVSHIGNALRNRFQWYRVDYPELETWLSLMEKIGRPIDIKIAAYLLSIGRKNYITYDPEKDQYAFSTNRSLEKASIAVADIDKKDYELLHKIVGGFLGNDWATDWVEFLQLSDKIDIDAILKHPEKIREHEHNLGVFYSLCVGLTDVAKTKTKINPIIDVVCAMTRDDFGLLVLGTIIKQVGAISFAKDYLVKRPDFKVIKERYMPLLATISQAER